MRFKRVSTTIAGIVIGGAVLLPLFQNCSGFNSADLDDVGSLDNSSSAPMDFAAPNPDPARSDSFDEPVTTANLKYELKRNIADVFPSVILSMLPGLTKSADDLRTNTPFFLGYANGAFTLLVQAKKPNAHIKVSVLKNSLVESDSENDFVLPDPTVVYDVSPLINWNHQQLLATSQVQTENFSFRISTDSQDDVLVHDSPSVRSVNDAVLRVPSDYSKKYPYALGSFAGFVNENSPAVDNILLGIKTLYQKTGKTMEFTGYQGDPQSVTNQVFAVWFYLESIGMNYSSIKTPSTLSDQVFAQSVRFVQQSLNAQQANCVDGSVLFASVLRKIGLDATLVAKKGHMYLQVYLTSDRKGGEMFLETTMVGNYSFSAQNWTGTSWLNDWNQSQDAYGKAIQQARSTFINDEPFYTSDPKNYFVVPIKDMRELGIIPIGL